MFFPIFFLRLNGLASALCSLQKKDTFEYAATEHLRISGGYWGLMALCLLDAQGDLKRDEIIDFVKKCQHDNGEFLLLLGTWTAVEMNF